MSDDGIILRTEGLSKHYGGVRALEDANFELRAGEHVAIVGDNGAGKSTFVRQITGVDIPSAGKIFFEGRQVEFRTPIEARDIGIETVFQNLALADDLDVAANLFLGRERRYFNLGPLSILNEKLMEVLGDDVSMKDAFRAADDVLHNAVAGIAEIINCPGLVNVDRCRSGHDRSRGPA